MYIYISNIFKYIYIYIYIYINTIRSSPQVPTTSASTVPRRWAAPFGRTGTCRCWTCGWTTSETRELLDGVEKVGLQLKEIWMVYNLVILGLLIYTYIILYNLIYSEFTERVHDFLWDVRQYQWFCWSAVLTCGHVVFEIIQIPTSQSSLDGKIWQEAVV